jgi:hypothetical protein
MTFGRPPKFKRKLAGEFVSGATVLDTGRDSLSRIPISV